MQVSVRFVSELPEFANGASTAAIQYAFNQIGDRRCSGRPCSDRSRQSLKTDKSNMPTVTGSVDPVTGQVFGGVFGVSVSGGAVVDPLNMEACIATTACVQFGLGVYAGAGGSLGGGGSLEGLQSGSSDSWGFFGNIGAFGGSAGGSIMFGDGSVGGAKGYFGVGKGASGGVQFCRTSLTCLGD